MNMTVVLGLHKFSLQAIIDHHGPSMYSGHYTASIKCCKRTFYCKVTEFEILDTKYSSTAYVVMYTLIIWCFRTRSGGCEFWLLPWRWHILSIQLNAGRGISAETCVLDDVFPPDDLGFGLCTPFIIYIPHIIATFLLIKINSFKKHRYQKLVWPCWCIRWFDTVWFQLCFQLYGPVFSMLWCGYRYLWHCTLLSITASPYSLQDWFSSVRCSSVECH